MFKNSFAITFISTVAAQEWTPDHICAVVGETLEEKYVGGEEKSKDMVDLDNCLKLCYE